MNTCKEVRPLEILIAIVNVFFVPAISLYLFVYSPSKQEGPALTGKHLLQYCIFTVLNLLFTKLIVKAVTIASGIVFSAASTYYTIIAVLVSVILPYIIKLLRRSVQIHIELTERSK